MNCNLFVVCIAKFYIFINIKQFNIQKLFLNFEMILKVRKPSLLITVLSLLFSVFSLSCTEEGYNEYLSLYSFKNTGSESADK